MSCSSSGPRGPPVREFWLSGTGTPAVVVSLAVDIAIAPVAVPYEQLPRSVASSYR